MTTFESYFKEYYENIENKAQTPRTIIKNKLIKLFYNIIVESDISITPAASTTLPSTTLPSITLPSTISAPAGQDRQQDRQQDRYIINLATEIEKSCFNATIQISKKSEEPPHRNWDSPIFYDIYSTRCGVILNILNPNSITCKTYGNKLLLSLLNDEIKASEIGFMSEKELCPESIAIECAEIEKRKGQKIEEKISTLFECPFCKQRKCSFTQVQLRSADEAPDYKCKCLNPECLRRFKGKG